MRHFSLTAHAITRYRERVRPGLDREAAERELRERVAGAPQPDERACQVVDLGDAVSVVAHPRGQLHWVIRTCLADEPHAPAMRDALERAGLVAISTEGVTPLERDGDRIRGELAPGSYWIVPT